MNKAQAIQFFGTQKALAQAIGIAQPSVAGWGEYPPADKQYAIYRASRGALAIEPSVIEKFGQPPAITPDSEARAA